MIVRDSSNNKMINCRNWTELVKPEQLVKDAKSKDNYGRFICEPLERGYGTTLGNALRRTLLSSLQGAAIVAIKIQGVEHEFTTIDGVMEDITDIVLNLKLVNLAMNTDEAQRLVLHADKKGEVTAADISENQAISVLNPEQHIATLSEDKDFYIEMEVRMGKSYVPAEMHEGLEEEIGLISMDASFSPIKKVAYSVEQARVGQMTNYDKLILEVWTDGSIRPEDSVSYSAKILKDQLSVFVNFDEQSTEVAEPEWGEGEEIDPMLFKSIDELELPVRASNCLKSADINLVGELVQKSEQEMLRTKNFGRKSLDDIRRVMNELGLEFGMKLDNFDEQYKEWLKRKQDDEA